MTRIYEIRCLPQNGRGNDHPQIQPRNSKLIDRNLLFLVLTPVHHTLSVPLIKASRRSTYPFITSTVDGKRSDR